MRSGCSKGNKDLRDIFTQKKREKMIKIRHVEKNYSTHSVLTLMDIDTRGNWLHFLFNPISPINNGRDRCWAIFCSFFWVNHPLMDPFGSAWILQMQMSSSISHHRTQSIADHMPGFCRLTQFEYQFPIDMKHRWESLFNQAKNKSSIYLFTILIIQPRRFFIHKLNDLSSSCIIFCLKINPGIFSVFSIEGKCTITLELHSNNSYGSPAMSKTKGSGTCAFKEKFWNG